MPKKPRGMPKQVTLAMARLWMIYLLSMFPQLARTGSHRAKKGPKKAAHRSKKLSRGRHRVKVGKHMRNIEVLASGKWKFLKG